MKKVLIIALILALAACKTTKFPDGTVIREIDREAIQYALTVAPEAMDKILELQERRDKLLEERRQAESDREKAAIGAQLKQVERGIEFLERVAESYAQSTSQ